LALCDEAIEIADRNEVEEGKLHYVAKLTSADDQVELIQQIIQHNLTVKQIKDIVGKGQDVLTFSLALKPSEDVDANHIAQAFISLERDKAVAKARIRALREMLEEAESYLD
jgi:hypothetical protein